VLSAILSLFPLPHQPSRKHQYLLSRQPHKLRYISYFFPLSYTLHIESNHICTLFVCICSTSFFFLLPSYIHTFQQCKYLPHAHSDMLTIICSLPTLIIFYHSFSHNDFTHVSSVSSVFISSSGHDSSFFLLNTTFYTNKYIIFNVPPKLKHTTLLFHSTSLNVVNFM